MGWTPYTYYTSSPCEVYYAFKGYFDKKEYDMLIMRKVAQSASAGFIKPGDFETFWPMQKESGEGKPSWAASSLDLRKRLMEKFKK